MRARSGSRTFIAAVAGLASGALFAQPSPTVTISFVGASASAVPLDPWSSLAAGLLIAAAAYAFFRRSGAGRFGRLSAWLAVIAAAAGVVIGASRVDVVATAHAIGMATPLLLTSSPASIVVGAGGAFIEARNATGATITINAVRLDNAVPGQAIVRNQGRLRSWADARRRAVLLCQRAVDRFVIRSESPAAAPSAVRARAARRSARRRRSGSRSRAGWWRWRAQSPPSARRTSAASCPSRARRPHASGCSTRSCS